MKPQGEDFDFYLKKIEADNARTAVSDKYAEVKQAKIDAADAEDAALTAEAEDKPATAEAKRKEAEAKRAEAEVLEIDAKQAEAEQANKELELADAELKQAETQQAEANVQRAEAEDKAKNAKGKRAKKAAEAKKAEADKAAEAAKTETETKKKEAEIKKTNAQQASIEAQEAETKRTAAEAKKAEADKKLHDAQINQKIEEAKYNPDALDSILKSDAYRDNFKNEGEIGFSEIVTNYSDHISSLKKGWEVDGYFSARAKKSEAYQDSNGNNYCTEWATIKCNQSTHFLKLRLLPGLRKMNAHYPIASTFDNIPVINVPLEPWNRCYSLANPLTLSATMTNFAATKVWKIIPMPCIFVPIGHWKGMANACDTAAGNFGVSLMPTYIKEIHWRIWDKADYPKAQALTQDCTLSCLFAGEFTINQCGQKDATAVPYNIVTGLIGPDIFSCLHNAFGILSNHVGLAGSLLVAAADSIVTGIESDSWKEGLSQFVVSAATIGIGARIGKGLGKVGLGKKMGSLGSKYLDSKTAKALQAFVNRNPRKLKAFSIAFDPSRFAADAAGAKIDSKTGNLINKFAAPRLKKLAHESANAQEAQEKAGNAEVAGGDSAAANREANNSNGESLPIEEVNDKIPGEGKKNNESSVKNAIQEEIKAIDEKLKDKNISPEDKQKLNEQRKQLENEQKDYDKRIDEEYYDVKRKLKESDDKIQKNREENADIDEIKEEDKNIREREKELNNESEQLAAQKAPHERAIEATDEKVRNHYEDIDGQIIENRKEQTKLEEQINTKTVKKKEIDAELERIKGLENRNEQIPKEIEQAQREKFFRDEETKARQDAKIEALKRELEDNKRSIIGEDNDATPEAKKNRLENESREIGEELGGLQNKKKDLEASQQTLENRRNDHSEEMKIKDDDDYWTHIEKLKEIEGEEGINKSEREKLNERREKQNERKRNYSKDPEKFEEEASKRYKKNNEIIEKEESKNPSERRKLAYLITENPTREKAFKIIEDYLGPSESWNIWSSLQGFPFLNGFLTPTGDSEKAKDFIFDDTDKAEESFKQNQNNSALKALHDEMKKKQKTVAG